MGSSLLKEIEKWKHIEDIEHEIKNIEHKKDDIEHDLDNRNEFFLKIQIEAFKV